MVETSADASTALGRATNEANAALTQLQFDFTLARKNFRDELMQDLDAATEQAQSFLQRLVASMDAAVQTAISKVISATREVESETAHLIQVSTWENECVLDLAADGFRMSMKQTPIRLTYVRMLERCFSRLLRAVQN